MFKHKLNGPPEKSSVKAGNHGHFPPLNKPTTRDCGSKQTRPALGHPHLQFTN